LGLSRLENNSTSYSHPQESHLYSVHYAMEYDASGQPVLRVNNIGGTGFNTLGNISASSDAFGRLRISNPVTLFDSAHRYKDNGKFSTVTAGAGTTSYNTYQSSILMTVGTASGDKVYRETYRVFAYQPGKSLLILVTFVMAPAKANLRQRVGYFKSTNGVYFEQDNTSRYLVIRKNTSGSVDDTSERIAQANWNVDKLDGTGISGITLDTTKAQIFWTDIEWLGVGSVRCGFVINGQFIVCHVFHHANILSTVYMRTATLPIRYEIENTAATSSSSTMLQICASAMSEGGYEARTKQWRATRTTAIASTSVASGWAPVVSIRLASGREDAVILPGAVHIAGDGNNSLYEYAIIRNATITGGSWVAHTDSGGNVEYNVSATSMTGGTTEDSGFFASSNQSNNLRTQEIDYNWEQQLGRDQTPTSDTITLATRHLVTGGVVYGSLNWHDLV
jgi:hypothetical protein